MKTIEFSTLLASRTGAPVLPVPREASAALGARERVEVRGTLNGHPLRGAAMPDGKGGHVIPLTPAAAGAAGLEPGDRAIVVLELDSATGELAVPPDLEKELQRNVAARRLWAKLSADQQKAFVEWVASSRGSALRLRRVVEVVQRIAMGKTTAL